MGKSKNGVRHLKANTYEIKYQVKGHRKQYRVKASSMSEARIIREEHKVEFRKSVLLSEKGECKIDTGINEAWEKFYADIKSDNLNCKTIQHYTRTYWRMFAEYRDKEWQHIIYTNQINLSFLKGYKQYYVNELERVDGWRSELIFVKATVRRLYNLGLCHKEIVERMTDMKKPYSKKKEYPNVSTSKLAEMMAFLKKDNPEYYRIIYYISRTGRRIGESTQIERGDVEWLGIKPIKINIRASTTKKQQHIPLLKLDEKLEQVIKEANMHSIRQTSDYLFSNRLGKKCTAGRVRDYLKKVSGQITGIAVTPHYFRHRFLTECGKANVPLVDVMAIAGIKDMNVVIRHYSHTTSEGLEKVLKQSDI